MRQVNDPQYFLNQATEQEFQDDVMIRRKTIPDDTGLNLVPSMLQQETATLALQVLSFHFMEKWGYFKRDEMIVHSWKNRIASTTKLAVENFLGIDLDSDLDNWLELNFDGLGNRERIRLLRLWHSNSPKKSNIEFWEVLRKMHWGNGINKDYREVDIHEAILELEWISFMWEEQFIYAAIVEQIRTSYEENTDGNMEFLKVQALLMLVKEFHFFAVQYHYFSFQKTTKQQDEMFQLGLNYFFEKTKSELNPDLKVVDPLDELGVPDFWHVSGATVHRRDK